LRDSLLKKESLDYDGLKDIIGPLPDHKQEVEEINSNPRILASI